jgi:hypothetical protein
MMAAHTSFSRKMLCDPANCGAIILAVVSVPVSAVRPWMQAVTG